MEKRITPILNQKFVKYQLGHFELWQALLSFFLEPEVAVKSE